MKRGRSSAFTIPFSISSALPIIPWMGVLSSWDTFAVNSRRLRSPFSCSVISKASITAPIVLFSDSMRLMSNWYIRPSRSSRVSLCPLSSAWVTALLIWRLRSTVRKS